MHSGDDDDEIEDEVTVEEEEKHFSSPVSCLQFFIGSAIVSNVLLIITFIILLFKLYLQHEHDHISLTMFVPPAQYTHYGRFSWDTFLESKRDSYAVLSQFSQANIQVLILREQPTIDTTRIIQYQYSGELEYLEGDYDYEFYSFPLLPGSTVDMDYYLGFGGSSTSSIYLDVLNNDYLVQWQRRELPSYLYDTFNMTLNSVASLSYEIGVLYNTPSKYDFIFYYADRFNRHKLKAGDVFFDVTIPNHIYVDKKIVIESCNLKTSDCWIPPHSIVVFNVTGTEYGKIISIKAHSAQGDFSRLLLSLIPLAVLVALDVCIVFIVTVKCVVRIYKRRGYIASPDPYNDLDEDY
jgi:hypothetical protein